MRAREVNKSKISESADKDGLQGFHQSLKNAVRGKMNQMQADVAIMKAQNPTTWQWKVGDQVYSPQTGKTYTIIYTNVRYIKDPKTKQRVPEAIYGYQRGEEGQDNYERGMFIADRAHKSLTKLTPNSDVVEATGDARFDAMMGRITDPEQARANLAIGRTTQPQRLNPSDVNEISFFDYGDRVLEKLQKIAEQVITRPDILAQYQKANNEDNVDKVWAWMIKILGTNHKSLWELNQILNDVAPLTQFVYVYQDDDFGQYIDLWEKYKEDITKLDEQGVAEGKVKLYTDPDYFGAEVDDSGFDSLPVVNIPANQLVGFEPDDKMNQPKSQANVEKIVAGLKKGDRLPPILVRRYKDGYQVVDGHHRFWAYKSLGIKSIPAQVVPAEDIEEVGKTENQLNEVSSTIARSRTQPGNKVNYSTYQQANAQAVIRLAHERLQLPHDLEWQPLSTVMVQPQSMNIFQTTNLQKLWQALRGYGSYSHSEMTKDRAVEKIAFLVRGPTGTVVLVIKPDNLRSIPSKFTVSATYIDPNDGSIESLENVNKTSLLPTIKTATGKVNPTTGEILVAPVYRKHNVKIAKRKEQQRAEQGQTVDIRMVYHKIYRLLPRVL